MLFSALGLFSSLEFKNCLDCSLVAQRENMHLVSSLFGILVSG